MNPEYNRESIRLIVPVLACGWLFSTGAIAQVEEQQVEELAPIVLEERGEPADPLFDDENAEAADNPEELAPIVLEERGAPDDSFLDEDNATVVASPESYDETLQRLFFAYRESVLAQMFDEADTLAKQIVELSIEVNGLDSRKTAMALTNLAVAQHGMEDYQSAILNYTAAIGIIERVADRLNSALINPLRGLGAAHFAAGRPDLAKKTFDRAIHISHVNDGPHNLDQIESLLSLSEIYLAVGETSDAVDIQKRIFYLQAHNIQSNSIDMIPALRTRASWQRRMAMYEQERFTWRRIIKIVETHEGKESLALIGPLTDLANSYLSVVYVNLSARAQPANSSGEPYLKRAVRIAERNPDATLQTRIDTRIKLGDYYILTDRSGRAHSVYRDVWDLLSEDEATLGQRATLLESGELLRAISPPKMLDDAAAAAGGGMPAGYLSGTVLFGYTANTRGRATNVRLLEADPKGLNRLYKQIARELRLIVHRPMIVDGEPMPIEDLTFSHEFYYREADLEEKDAKNEIVTENKASN